MIRNQQTTKAPGHDAPTVPVLRAAALAYRRLFETAQENVALGARQRGRPRSTTQNHLRQQTASDGGRPEFQSSTVFVLWT